MPKAEIVQAPARRRKQNRYTEGELATFAEAIPTLEGNFAVKVGEAAAENDARTIARDAQRELRDRHNIESRTSVFANANASGFIAALRKKSGESGGPTIGAGNATPISDSEAPDTKITAATSTAGGTRLRVGRA